jgi:uncharacterized membrane protein YphA (DoxX/SURF4 family)
MSEKLSSISWPKLACVFRIILGLIFLYAGCEKILDPLGFAVILNNYKLLPSWAINPIAILLPWLEAVAGTCLFLGFWTIGSALLVSALLFVFTGALSINLIRGLDISCGCFNLSSRADTINWLYILRDLGFLFMGLHVFFFDRGFCSLWKRKTGA